MKNAVFFASIKMVIVYTVLLFSATTDAFAADSSSANLAVSKDLPNDQSLSKALPGSANINKKIYSPNPRHTVEHFVDLMFAGTGKRSDSAALSQAIQYIEPPHDIRQSKTQSVILEHASDLFALLKTLDYSRYQVPDKAKEGIDEITVSLGDSKMALPFTFKKTKDYGWVFADSNFSNPQIMSYLQDLDDLSKSLENKSKDFIPELCTPLRTLFTFSYGIENCNGYDIEDAVSAINFAGIDKQIVKEKGKIWAIQLHRILYFASPILRESIPNNSFHDDRIVLLVDPEYGLITLDLWEDPESNQKAWKINFNGISFLVKVYDAYMAHGMRKVIGKMKVANPPLSIVIDDFIQKHFLPLETVVFGANLWKWIFLLLFIGLCFILCPLIRILFMPLVRKLLEFAGLNTGASHKRFLRPLQISIVSYLFLQVFLMLSSAPAVLYTVIILLNVVMMFTISWVAWGMIDCFCLAAENNLSSKMHIFTSLTGNFLKALLVVFVLLYFSNMFGLNGTKFFTALGISGFALAMAGKDTIENVFGSVMILADRPFKKGDWIKVDNVEGSVEQVGARCTRIRTFYDSVITVPNRLFISSKVDNMGMRTFRRFKTDFCLKYDTHPDKIREFTAKIKEVICAHRYTRKDRYHVNAVDLKDGSVSILVYVFFAASDFSEELTAKEMLILQVLEVAKNTGIELALPSRDVYFNSSNIPQQPETAKGP